MTVNINGNIDNARDSLKKLHKAICELKNQRMVDKSVVILTRIHKEMSSCVDDMVRGTNDTCPMDMEF